MQVIQIWLKSTRGPIEVFLCPEEVTDEGGVDELTAEPLTSNPDDRLLVQTAGIVKATRPLCLQTRAINPSLPLQPISCLGSDRLLARSADNSSSIIYNQDESMVKDDCSMLPNLQNVNRSQRNVPVSQHRTVPQSVNVPELDKDPSSTLTVGE